MSILYRALLSYLLGFLVLLGLLSGSLVWSYGVSAREWRSVKLAELEAAILERLAEGEYDGMSGFPQDIAVFVYGPDGDFLFSNRGAGRRRAVFEPDMSALRLDGRLVAYYSAGSLNFYDNSANQAFLVSMTRALQLAFLFSLLIASLIAWCFARSISRPARRVQTALEAISQGQLRLRVDEAGPRELRSIAGAANQLAASLEHEQGLRRQWVQDIAHDLRTPVAALTSQFEAMVDGVLLPDGERLRRLQAELRRVQTLIGSFEDLLRLEAPDLAIKPSPIHTEALLEGLRERFSPAMSRRGLVLECRSTIPVLEADEALLFRALSNILDNAVRYSHPDSQVSLRVDAWSGAGDSPAAAGAQAVGVSQATVGAQAAGASQAAGAVGIRVHNRGTVIAASDLSRIFERSYRADYSRASDGSGLGLTIAKRIVELHGGSIAARSSQEEGTEFSVYLPGFTVSSSGARTDSIDED